jgi:hypothetical protein
MIHDATIVNTGRRDRKTNVEIKKPYAAVQYIGQISTSAVTQF